MTELQIAFVAYLVGVVCGGIALAYIVRPWSFDDEWDDKND